MRGQIGRRRLQQRLRGLVVETVERELRKPGLVERACNAFSEGEEHNHGLVLEAPGDEAEHLGRRPVEPLRILDDEEQRALGLAVGQQAERRQADQEWVRRLAVGPADHGLERCALGLGESVEPVEERYEQPVQPGEGQPRLWLRPGRRDDRHLPLASPCGGRLEQRRLADPGLSAHDERAAPLADPAYHGVELRQLVVAAEELDARLGLHARHVHLASSAPTLPRCSRSTETRPSALAYRRAP